MRRAFKLRSRTGRVLKTVMAVSPQKAAEKMNKSGVIIMTSSTKVAKTKKLYVYSVDKKKKQITKRAEWTYSSRK